MVKINNGAELVGIIDTDISLKSDLAAEFGVPFCTNLDDFFYSNIKVDVVNICTPNYLHV